MPQSFLFDYSEGSIGYTVNNEGIVIGKTSLVEDVHITVTEESDDGSFSIGDSVSVETPFGDTPLTGTITGVTPTGVLIQVNNGTEAYSYLTTDLTESYEVGDMLPFSTDNSAFFPVCFVRGTLLETVRGLVAIEDIRQGDQVRSSSGLRTVKWVGWRHYGPFFLRTTDQQVRSAPVRIRQHALADNQPTRDLLVSPWHHILVDGMLVRANDLVNGTTITQETPVTSVDYYHVELDRFDVLLAHGVYSESWADGGNRDFFQNVDATTLRPEDKKRRLAPRPGFDHLVLRKGEKLEAIQARIATRAQAMLSQSGFAEKVA